MPDFFKNRSAASVLVRAAAGVGLLVALPFVFKSQAAISLMCQMGITIVFCMSYNLLLGQGGMLSFGHSIFSGLAGYAAAYVLNHGSVSGFVMPIALLPLASGLFGLAIAAVFGYLCTRTSGIAFTMITLGIGELAHAAVQMFPAVFGGEGGISINRTAGPTWLGVDFGSQRAVYGLIAVWAALSIAAIYGFTRTPMGRVLNAVRDNAERVTFIGFDAARIRYAGFMVSSLFAGIAGGLALVNSEIVGAESISLFQSGEALVFTFIGGTSAFAGPIAGAIVGVLLSVPLADASRAWVLYMGIIFVYFVLYAQEGVVGLAQKAAATIRANGFEAWLRDFAPSAILGALGVVGTILTVEMLYAIMLGAESVVAAQKLLDYTGMAPTAILAVGVVTLAMSIAIQTLRLRGLRPRRKAGAEGALATEGNAL